jgi:transcriptional antiterminator NusG
MKTYILKVATGFENKVKENIISKIEKENLTDYIGDIFIPEHDTKVVTNGKRIIKKTKLFSNYIIIELADNIPLSIIRLIVGLNKVQGFLGINKFNPSPISEEEKSKILKPEKTCLNKKELFKYGDEVKITSGPFLDFCGNILAVSNNKAKVNVSVFGRLTPIDIYLSDISSTY